MTCSPELITPDLLRTWELPHDEHSKHDRGHVLVIGGARRTPGAAMLTGWAALRVGGGVLTLAVAQSVAPAVAVAVPEAGVIGLPENDAGSVRGICTPHLREELRKAQVVVVGPGLDDPDSTSELLTSLTPDIPDEIPVLLDAYALGVLGDLPDVVARLAGRLVLTPNHEELQRLAGADGDDDLHRTVESVAVKYDAIVTCHGAIAEPEGRCWQTTTGHSGLATAGSGDVLAGAIAGLLARGTDPARAACWGTHLHAAAGDRLTSAVGSLGFLAGELTRELPMVMREIER